MIVSIQYDEQLAAKFALLFDLLIAQYMVWMIAQNSDIFSTCWDSMANFYLERVNTSSANGKGLLSTYDNEVGDGP